MAYFAQIDSNNIVTRVIVAEQTVIDSGIFGDPTTFVETDVNEKGGNGNIRRKNYAGIGFSYDKTKNSFIPPDLKEIMSQGN